MTDDTKHPRVECPACRGSRQDASSLLDCHTCHGRGTVIAPKDFRCPYCGTVRPNVIVEPRVDKTLAADIHTATVFCQAPGCGRILGVTVLGLTPPSGVISL